MQMSAVVNKHRIRHGHMVNITRQIMLEGMRADFRAVDALSQRLVERARRAKRISCRTPAGTDFEAEISPELKWLKDQRHHHTGKMGQPSRWRDFYFTRQHQWRLRRGWRGRRLSLPEIWRPAGRRR